MALENKALRFLLDFQGLAAAEIDAYLHTAMANLNAGSRLSLQRTGSAQGSLESALLAASEPSLRDTLEDGSTPLFLRQPTIDSLPPSHAFHDSCSPPDHRDDAGQQAHMLEAQGKRNESEVASLQPQPQHRSPGSRSSRRQPGCPLSSAAGFSDGDVGSGGGDTECQKTLPAQAGCSCAHEPAPLPKHATSAGSIMEKSCEEAASILAQLREGSELDEIRRDLGCWGEGACVIRNTELLHIMDKLPSYS